jgi:hypothetical protein
MHEAMVHAPRPRAQIAGRAVWIRVLSTLIAVGWSAGPPRAGATGTGIGGFSGKAGPEATCNACHAGGIAPDVRFEGPTALAAGTTGSYRFVVRSRSSAQRYAGFNVAVGDEAGAFAGRLDPGEGARPVSSFGGQCPRPMPQCEITHLFPTEVDEQQEVGWSFTWRAPDEPGTYVLYGAGNSVDTDVLGPGGDLASATAIVVAVAAPAPTPTPTPGPPCPGDCNHDDAVDAAELVTGISIGLGMLRMDRCAAVDRNQDEHVTVDEIVAAVAASLSGCQ